MEFTDSKYHIAYVVYVSETGDVAPQLLIIIGQRLNRNFLYGCDIPGAVVTCATKCS